MEQVEVVMWDHTEVVSTETMSLTLTLTWCLRKGEIFRLEKPHDAKDKGYNCPIGIESTRSRYQC